jgi:putative ABC transport system substrate-binding protein
LAGFKKASHGEIRIYENRENGSLNDERVLTEQVAKRNPALILTIGQEAFLGLDGALSSVPKVFCMALPNAALIDPVHNLTGVTLATDPSQLATTLDELYPGPMQVGAVYDPSVSSALIEAARIAFQRYGKVLNAVPAADFGTLTQQVKGLMDRVDAYWMVPDRTLKDRDTLRFLLFASKKQGKPLIGPSKKYVKAGALLALAPDNFAIGLQTAALANKILSGIPPSDLPIQPAYDSIMYLNRKTAETQGLQVPVEMKRKVHYVD